MWADAGHTGRFVRDARNIWDLAVAIVKRPTQAKGFVLPHHRWVMERSFARLTKFRRLVHNSETLPATPDAVLRRTSPADSARLGALISGRYPRNVSERRP
ncbi:hypothetical protein ABZ656_44440 [Streptomyces sp. NPDC007095]|uniref:hypothetical protein n=1 Tax=Streptomyces sp. NPDC007095 TaxID=3154482 RepID=UPI0033D534D9